MNETRVRLLNPEGMHARPAGLIVQRASQFQSQIQIQVGAQKKSAKSLIGILSLGLKFNDEITITADGDDAQSALSSLSELFSKSIQS